MLCVAEVTSGQKAARSRHAMGGKDCPPGEQWDTLVNDCIQSGLEINDGIGAETRAEAATSGESQPSAGGRKHKTTLICGLLIGFLEAPG